EEVRKAEEERIRLAREAEERAEAARKAEEVRKAEEERARLAREAEEKAEAARKAEEVRKADEERTRLAREAEDRAEASRKAEEARKAEEERTRLAREAEERAEAARKAEEARKAAEERVRLADEQARVARADEARQAEKDRAPETVETTSDEPWMDAPDERGWSEGYEPDDEPAAEDSEALEADSEATGGDAAVIAEPVELAFEEEPDVEQAQPARSWGRKKGRKQTGKQQVAEPANPASASADEPDDLLEERLERERTTSLLKTRRKRWFKRRNTPQDRSESAVVEALLDQAEKRAALAHTTSLLTTLPRNDRLEPRRERRGSGFFVFIFFLGLAGAGLYLYDPTLFPADLQEIDVEKLT